MTIGATMHPYEQEEIIPEGKRLRMKDWLKIRIGNPRYPGLEWVNKEQQIFKIPWKHAALQGWNQNSDGALFRDWAEHTGSCVRNAHPKTLKATFRCALHSLPDVHEDKKLAKKRGDDACRVYRFIVTSSSAPKKRHIRIRNHHKEKGRGKLKTLPSKQNHEITPQYGINISQQFSQPSLNWNYPLQSGSCSLSCSDTFIPPQITTAVSSHMHFQDQQRPWLMQNEAEGHNSLPITGSASSNTMASPMGYHDGFKPMQHSISDPNIAPYYRAENQNFFEHGIHLTQSQSSIDAFTMKGQFEEKMAFHSPPPPGTVSPTSRSISDPGTPPCYFSENSNPYDCLPSFGGKCNSPIVSPSSNTKSREAIYHGQQHGAASPINSDYASNASPASSVVSTCPSSNQLCLEYFPMGNGQAIDNAECMSMPIVQSSDSVQNYQILDNISKSLDQRGTSPYYGDTISASVLSAPSNAPVSSATCGNAFSYPTAMMNSNSNALLNKAEECVTYDTESHMTRVVAKQSSYFEDKTRKACNVPEEKLRVSRMNILHLQAALIRIQFIRTKLLTDYYRLIVWELQMTKAIEALLGLGKGSYRPSRLFHHFEEVYKIRTQFSTQCDAFMAIPKPQFEDQIIQDSTRRLRIGDMHKRGRPYGYLFY